MSLRSRKSQELTFLTAAAEASSQDETLRCESLNKEDYLLCFVYDQKMHYTAPSRGHEHRMPCRDRRPGRPSNVQQPRGVRRG